MTATVRLTHAFITIEILLLPLPLHLVPRVPRRFRVSFPFVRHPPANRGQIHHRRVPIERVHHGLTDFPDPVEPERQHRGRRRGEPWDG
jgi:hypothetical protein